MKHILVFIVMVSLFLTSCASDLPGKIVDEDFDSSLPTQSVSLIKDKKFEIYPLSITGDTVSTFKQAFRLGDGTFNFIEYRESYPLNLRRSKIELVHFDQNAPFTNIEFDFDVYYKINILEAFNVERYHVPQFNLPLAYFILEDKIDDNLITTTPYFLHLLMTDTHEKELWVSNSTKKFTYKIDTIDHIEIYPRPMAYYNNYIDYYNGWIAYTKGNDIHLINLFAELALIEDDHKIDFIDEITDKLENFDTFLSSYQSFQSNRIIPDALNTIFKPETPLEMKRLLHLHELEDYILLTFPTQNNTNLFYIFDKQFINPPHSIEFAQDSYRIYYGSKTHKDNPLILMFDTFANEIDFYNISTKEKDTLDAKQFLSPANRHIQNIFLVNSDGLHNLIIFPESFKNIQKNHFIIIELDESMTPFNTIKVNIDSDLVFNFYQAIYRRYHNDIILLASDQLLEHYQLIQFSLETKSTNIKSNFYYFPYMKANPLMLYHPDSFFVLQATTNNILGEYAADHKKEISVNFYNLSLIDSLLDDFVDDEFLLSEE